MFVGNKVYKIKILVTQSFKYNFLPVLVSLLTLTTVVKIKEAKACAWDGIEDFAVLLNYKCQLFHMCLTQHYCDKTCKSSIYAYCGKINIFDFFYQIWERDKLTSDDDIVWPVTTSPARWPRRQWVMAGGSAHTRQLMLTLQPTVAWIRWLTITTSGASEIVWC